MAGDRTAEMARQWRQAKPLPDRFAHRSVELLSVSVG
jgi:hypothetical protein